jgi:hypothetical protein
MSVDPTPSAKRLDVDAFLGVRESWLDRLTTAVALRWTLGRLPRVGGAALSADHVPCDRLAGVRLVRAAASGGAPGVYDPERGLLVGTLRMGYGHHRIARSVSTWALAREAIPYLSDPLELPGAESRCVANMDRAYSRCSRWATELGGVVDWLWGRLMTRGGASTLRYFCRLAEALTPLMSDLPRGLPVVCAHPLNAQIALACGFERVINLVIDNHPQPFVLAPGALNLVQSPGYRMRLLELGVPAEAVRVAGHWVPHDLLDSLGQDVAARLDRAQQGAPLRVLLPVGGAGGQRRFLGQLLARLSGLVQAGRVRLLVNAGDHRQVRLALADELAQLGLPPRHVGTWDELLGVCAEARRGGTLPPVTLFGFERHDHGFAATDHLARCADLLVTKPSELAFYPLPKLHIRRVGGHEAASALRSAELGDGTPECRTPAAAADLLRKLLEARGVLGDMSLRIADHAAAGVYDGSRVAVDLALSGISVRPPAAPVLAGHTALVGA